MAAEVSIGDEERRVPHLGSAEDHSASASQNSSMLRVKIRSKLSLTV